MAIMLSATTAFTAIFEVPTQMNVDVEVVTLIGVILALITAIFGAFKYFNSEIGAVRREAEQAARTLAATESKARHDMNNQNALLVARLDLELNKVRDQFNQLSLDVVRKADLSAFESRIMQGITASEQRQITALDKTEALRQGQFGHIENKLDRVMESVRRGMPNSPAGD